MNNESPYLSVDRSYLVYSKLTVDGASKGVAIPVLDFEGMKPENSFEMFYDLQIVDHAFSHLSKIPVEWKNIHRQFWGMKLLPMSPDEQANFEELKKKVRLPKAPHGS